MIRAVMYSGNSFDHGKSTERIWYKKASFHVSKSTSHSYRSFVPADQRRVSIQSNEADNRHLPRMLTMTVFFVTRVKYVALP